jgi:demethylmenaquinone methyltransferase/2-methoxy-6-polyprenyl-1,4-benzoquinol methylase
MPDQLGAYYAARAAEYEAIYAKPERQGDLAELRRIVPAYFTGRHVLEVACGTGWWTQWIAPVAASVTAVDVNEEVLEIARAKALPERRVHFARADVHRLPARFRHFSASFAGFWWSHLPIAGLRPFLASLHRALAPGAVAVALDNRYVEGSSTPIALRDEQGNTFQRRKLADGSEHLVLKNFPREAGLRAALDGIADAIEYLELEYYWLIKYEVVS